jgi:hypothetical protein
MFDTDFSSTNNTFVNQDRLIMRLVILSIIASLLAGCATQPGGRVTASKPPVAISDPIDRLVAKLSPPQPPPDQSFTSTGGWGSGTFSIIDLPATASADEVVSEVMQRWHFTSYKILEVRQVHIPTVYWDTNPSATPAALVDTNVGEKIVLFFYTGPDTKWNVRVYDVEPPAP